jgi:hypothetical protein
MEELVWRKEGERCERSYRTEPAAQQQTQAAHQQTQVQMQAQQTQAAQQHNDINSVHRQEPDGFRQNNNKREQANDKINERFLIGTPNQNPFMTSTSYFDDIEVQLNYLTPQKGDI